MTETTYKIPKEADQETNVSYTYFKTHNSVIPT